MSSPAGGGYDVERSAVRVVLRDAAGSVFLFRTVDAADPGAQVWWELPGGGVELGESPAETAVRELREETGFVVDVSVVSTPRWQRSASYARRRLRYLQHEVVVEARIATVGPEPVVDGRTAIERVEYVGHRWWRPEDLAGSAERFFPGRLPALLGPFLDGEDIDEPFEHWN